MSVAYILLSFDLFFRYTFPFMAKALKYASSGEVFHQLYVGKVTSFSALLKRVFEAEDASIRFIMKKLKNFNISD